MKKINKYFNSSETPSLAEGLKQYKNFAASVRNNAQVHTSKKSGPLTWIIPFAAASLSPFAIAAQCSATITTPGAGGNAGDIFIDIDGDGTSEFLLNPNNGHLFLEFLTPDAEAIAVGPTYFYATQFSTNDPISSANPNWVGAGAPAYVTLDYGANGDWHTWPSGFVAVRVGGDQLGFIQVTWNDATDVVTVNAALTGVQDPVETNTTVSAGICASLPVELVSFEAELEGKTTRLTWTTHSEYNNRGFEVQRSTDGVNFHKIGFVNGQGDTAESIDYDFSDENIESNRRYYYRLKQMDYWDAFAYSNVIHVQTERTLRFDILENPTSSDQLTVNFATEGNDTWEFTIFDMQGKQRGEIVQISNNDAQLIEMDIQQLGSGTYFLKLSGAGTTEYRKFVKSIN